MCKCKDKSNWRVIQWLACWHYIGNNRTYRRAKSSLVECGVCGKKWRTSADYVDLLAKKYDTPYISSISGDIIWKEL